MSHASDATWGQTDGYAKDITFPLQRHEPNKLETQQKGLGDV